MTEEDRKLLIEAYKKTFNYEPDEEETDKRYDKEFDEWCDKNLGK